jgi:arylsulfatase A-like enzyme
MQAELVGAHSMTRLLRIVGPLLPLVVLFVICGPAGSAEARKPNVIVILADDLGYGELGFQGNTEIPTPHIDSIARSGVRFTQGYVSGPYCSPTRAGLMTGRYQERFGHEFNEGKGALPFGLPVTETTFADRMKAAGYATCAIGKWHLGNLPQFRPMKRGFDEFYGTLANTPFLLPNLVDSRVGSDPVKVTDEAFYTTHAYGARAVEWIEGHKDQPFFLYLPFNAQHAPLQAPEKYLNRFTGIGDEKRRTFAAMLSAMDDAIGGILECLAANELDEDTLVFFLTDNGGPTQQTTSKNDPLRGRKATTLEGGIRVPFCVQWKGKIPAGQTYDNPVIQLDILPTALAAAGVEVSADANLDGVNLLPYLQGENAGKPHDTLYWRFGKQWAVRHGEWKLVASNIDGPENVRLHNLANDISESENLAGSDPEKVKELKALYETWNAQLMEPQWVPEPQRQQRQQQRNNPPGSSPTGS